MENYITFFVVIHSHCLCKDDHIKLRGYTVTGSNMNRKQNVFVFVFFSRVTWRTATWLFENAKECQGENRDTSICPQTENERGRFKLCGRRTRGSYQLLGCFLMHFKAILNIESGKESSKENKLFEEKYSPHFYVRVKILARNTRKQGLTA